MAHPPLSSPLLMALLFLVQLGGAESHHLGKKGHHLAPGADTAFREDSALVPLCHSTQGAKAPSLFPLRPPTGVQAPGFSTKPGEMGWGRGDLKPRRRRSIAREPPTHPRVSRSRQISSGKCELSCHAPGRGGPLVDMTHDLTSPGSKQQPCPPLENSMTQVREVGPCQSPRAKVTQSCYPATLPSLLCL